MPASSPERSLKTQIALVFGTLVIVLVTGLTAILGSMLGNRIRHDTEASLRLTADSISATLHRNLDYRSKQVVIMGRSDTLWIGGLDSRQARAALKRIHEYQPENRWAVAANDRGQLATASPRRRIGQDVAGQDWFSRGLQGAAVSVQAQAQAQAGAWIEGAAPSGPAARDDFDRSLVVFSAPIVLEGETVGVVGVHTAWEWVRYAVDQFMPSDAGEQSLDVVVFDRSGSLLHAVGAHGESLRASGQTLPSVGPRPSSVRWADGRHYLTAVAPVKPVPAVVDLGWTVVVRRPANQAYADARQAIAMTLCIGLLAAVAASAVAFLAARRISSDLSRIVDALGDVERGLPGAVIPSLGSSKETHALSQTLQRVTSRLLQSNQDMEARVRSRTLELEAANRELDLQARTDPLTGLFNRRGLSDHLDPALALSARGGRPLSLVVLDVDHFKRVNDRYGHVVGDDVLRHLASTLRERLRSSDLAARVGGEEFVVLLPDTGIAAAEPLAQELIDHVAARPHPVCGPLTLSAGVATHRAGDDAQSVFRRADRALYAAKSAGRNRVCAAAPFDSGEGEG
jgi:diguanylate cyclase (GGDEF)-like protein